MHAVRVLVFLLVAMVATFAQAWEAGSDGLAQIPALKQRVTDLTGTLPAADVQGLEAKLAAWETSTGNQLAVLVVPSTKPEPIEAYSIRVADAWKIGRKGQDNGAILVVAKDDKKLRIEVGYGFEGVLTDATSRRIIAEDIVPSFQGGRFAEGIGHGVDRIIAVVDKGEPMAVAPKARKSSGLGQLRESISFELALAFVFFVVPVIAGLLEKIFGRAVGSSVGAGVVGAAAWAVTGTVLIAVVAAIIALVVILYMGSGGGGGSGLSRRGGGVWTGSGGGGGYSGGGGGFSGGGGGFGGGGASGGWN